MLIPPSITRRLRLLRTESLVARPLGVDAGVERGVEEPVAAVVLLHRHQPVAVGVGALVVLVAVRRVRQALSVTLAGRQIQ